MNRSINCSPSCSKRVSDDNNALDVKGSGLNNTKLNSKQLCIDNTSLEALGPARANQVSKKESSIFSRPLSDATKLVGMKDTVLDSIKLESPGNHLLNELAKGVEQDNRSKGLGSVVGWFARLGNNDRD